jgi:hypothetical protein
MSEFTKLDAEGEAFRAASFDYIDRHIKQLVEKAIAKKLCPCCIARALLFNGANLCEANWGSTTAAESLAIIAAEMREHDQPMPGPHMQCWYRVEGHA